MEKKAVSRLRSSGQARNFPSVYLQIVFRLKTRIHAKYPQRPDQHRAQRFEDAADPRFQAGIIHVDAQTQGHDFRTHDHRPSPGAPPVVLYPLSSHRSIFSADRMSWYFPTITEGIKV